DELRHAFHQRAELEPLEDRADGVEVDRLGDELVELPVEPRVAHELVQSAIPHRVLTPLAEVLSHDALDLVGVREDAVEIAVEAEPLDGGLLSDLRDAGGVVARLAAQRERLGRALWADRVSL